MNRTDPALIDKQIPTRQKPRAWRIEDIIDGRALRVKLKTAAQMHGGDHSDARKVVLDQLHSALFRGRMIAQERLQQGADGLDTARLLSAVMDEVLHALYDYTISHVFKAANPTKAERLAVYATGGYGRSVLAPSSDVDILFIRPYKASAHAESVIEYMLYMLWDMGLKIGHAFRTPQECVRLAKSDVTIKTSLLDARFLFGDDGLATETAALFNKQVVKGQDAQFIADKLEERERRHARQGNTRYVVEPNIKEGKGGLRDLQTLYWIVKHLHPDGTVSLEDVMQTRVFTQHEYYVFLRAARFLWTVRCHLHYLTGRAEERLSFDLQPEIAARLGYRDRTGQLGVERFMKRYFIAARDVGNLTRILTAKLEAEQRKKPEGWRRFLPISTPKPLEDSLFHIDTQRIGIADEEAFLKSPANMLRLFWVADQEGLDIHPNALSLVTRNIRRITSDCRRAPYCVEIFLNIMLEARDTGWTLSRMNEAGVLGRFVPEFGAIVAQTQFNMYHHYTVDEHTLRAVEHVAKMDRGEDGFDLAHDLFQKIDNRRALYLAMLLHDTGKGLGDQQIEGMKTSRAACERLGFDDEEIELVAWLVGNHLEMSETAQKRDIADPRTIVNFAKLVGDLERLRLLYILTVADIRAVGPNIWNGWKDQLLADLYYNTEAALRGGRTDEHSVAAELSARAETHREAVKAELGSIPDTLDEMDPAYWTCFDLETLVEHARLLQDNPDHLIKAEPKPDAGGTELFMSGQDRAGLFARLATAIDALGANIVSAQVFTTPSDRIIDVFLLQDENGEPFAMDDPNRLQRLEKHVEEALMGQNPIVRPPPRPDARAAAFLVKPRVTISENLSTNNTVIDISGRDGPGLLSAVSSVLADADIPILSAHVGSYGERVFDAFYVKLPEGFDEAAKSSLREQILAALGRQDLEAPSTPARELRRAEAADSF